MFHNAANIATKVLTVRGRSGCVLVMAPIAGEDGGLIADCLRDLPAEGLQQTVAVFTDDPSARLLSALQNVLPNLQSLCLDPAHLCMSFEYGTFRKRTLASRTLRLMMNKFNAVDPKKKATYTSALFTGVDAPAFNHVTKSRREQILSGGMAKATAERILSSLKGDAPWTSEREFVEALAALARSFPDDVDKMIPGPNRTGRQILYTACAPARLQWYWNNLRVRHNFPQKFLAMLPSGTASNEALHSEIRAWFRETQQMHRSTLELKLRVLHLSKMITHGSAMQRPTLRQISSSVVLARCVCLSPWSQKGSWEEFASVMGKAVLPLNRRRKYEAEQVRQQSFKRPAVRKRPAMKHRTPFNRVRISKLKIMGKSRND